MWPISTRVNKPDLQSLKVVYRDRIDVSNGHHAATPWHCLNQDLLPFAVKLVRVDADPPL
jgi:hypothetical protein